MTLRVRFAPSPTGFLHVGGARTALFNWLLARKEEGVLVLRIEDTDQERSSEEHTQAILHGMEWLGVTWDEGPFFQSDGLDRHREAALSLLESGQAYRDFSTPEQAARDREEEIETGKRTRRARERADAMSADDMQARMEAGETFAVRFRVPDGETVWNDKVHGESRFRNAEIDDLVILRSNGTPTYNLAVVSDDAEMGINLVLRGDDHLSNTPKQILLHEALGNPVPSFAHVPLILGPDGKRLSKRHGATAVGDYEKEGILPGAMFNFLALLGWSPGDDREVFGREELVEVFSLERVLKKSSVFDFKKLEWLNGQHLAAMPLKELVEQVKWRLTGKGLLPEPPASGGREAIDIYFLVELLKVRARTVEDLLDQAEPYFSTDIDYEPKAVRKQWAKDAEAVADRLERLHAELGDVDWDQERLEEVSRGLAEELEIGAGKLFQPLRLALTGSSASPGIFDVLVLLGRERSLDRIQRAVNILRSGELPTE
ncbi:MAG: glutamate--tRNA ligase [Gemmatimonadetes bacterium]|nr:glutamate--tRNA ligase [Gemmatimonadota bacterium]NNM04469.1 glutamate--tRNA ligase [Gemmatimonadota bacterium]